MASTHELQHAAVPVNGVRIHYARIGAGSPLLLLHGWPEFWLTWEPVMRLLADRFDLIAPDFRGFGDSEKPEQGPSDRAGADTHAADMAALLDALGLQTVGIVAHDVGAAAALALARRHFDRLTGLFLFDVPYGGIGRRWAEAGHLKEIWYQSFNQMPWTASLIGSSRAVCRTYIGHFLRHWAARKDAFDDVLEAWVDNFLKPGNLQGGFNWYLSANAQRLQTIREELPRPVPITTPTCVRWGEQDPILPVAWADRLSDYFSDLDFAPFPGVGHFPHREDPGRAAAEIAAWFDRPAR